jgi:hypothetical protein
MSIRRTTTMPSGLVSSLRSLAMVISVILLASLAACGGNDSTTSNADTTSTTPVTVSTTEPTEVETTPDEVDTTTATPTFRESTLPVPQETRIKLNRKCNTATGHMVSPGNGDEIMIKLNGTGQTSQVEATARMACVPQGVQMLLVAKYNSPKNGQDYYYRIATGKMDKINQTAFSFQGEWTVPDSMVYPSIRTTFQLVSGTKAACGMKFGKKHALKEHPSGCHQNDTARVTITSATY